MRKLIIIILLTVTTNTFGQEPPGIAVQSLITNYTFRDFNPLTDDCVGDCQNGVGTVTYNVFVFLEGERYQIKEPVVGMSGQYSGSFKNGKPHGKGTMEVHQLFKYSGEYSEGKEHGKGIYTWPDGQKYAGDFKNGRKHGWGKMTIADEETGFPYYLGEWKSGKKHGLGEASSAKLAGWFIGEWEDNQRNGCGYWYTYDKGFHDNGIYIQNEFAYSQDCDPLANRNPFDNEADRNP
jgi:hypothetical protein